VERETNEADSRARIQDALGRTAEKREPPPKLVEALKPIPRKAQKKGMVTGSGAPVRT